MEQLRVVEFGSLEALMELLQMGRLPHENFGARIPQFPLRLPGLRMLQLALKRGFLRQRRASKAAIQRHGKDGHRLVALPSRLPEPVSYSLLLVSPSALAEPKRNGHIS